MDATPSITPAELLRLRMASLGLAESAVGAAPGPSIREGSAPAGPAPVPAGEASGPQLVAGVARRMLAVQGQDWRSARWALGVRAPGTTVDDVTAAFDAGLIVRSWPMRGTIHVVAAEDIGWMQRLTNHRVLAGAPKRREFLGMSDAVLDRLVEVSTAALAGGDSYDRDSLAAVWTEAGIEWRSNWRYHVIWWLCQNGIAVFGPSPGGGEPRLVLAADWIASPRELSGDEALAELAVRYTGARGPVRVKDLAWWSGLTVREAKQAVALGRERGDLVPLRLDGVAGATGELWAPADLADRALASGASGSLAPSWLLLPAFDEHLLGYTDRDAQLDPAHFERIVPGRNGMFLATAVHDGRVAGTWRRGSRKGSGLEVSPLPGEEVDLDGLAPEAARWAAFHGTGETPLSIAPAAAS